MLLLFAAACGGGEASNSSAKFARDESGAEIGKIKDAVAPFFKPMLIEPNDWLKTHPEDGQTFDEYLTTKPTLPTAERKTISIQPIGNFTDEQKRVLGLTADYMRAFYGLPVRLEREKALKAVPDGMTRTQYPNNRQIKTAYFLDDLLPKMLPPDATAFLCFTNSDLFPDKQWNYLFGQASLEKRVGIYSLYRLGEKGKGKAAFAKFLDRTLKIAMHETGHMFSMLHCTKYECLMSGTNHLAETDRRPLDVCPECMAKIAWALGYDPVDRYKNLAAFWAREGRTDEQKQMLAKAAAVESAKKANERK
ncbi:MAG: archaemetzincin [Pyrinomonadaceae bacterium]